MSDRSPPVTSGRLDAAFALARELHGGQVRKGTAIPYVSHLMAVASLVLEAGGDEDLAIAALLHDAVEDQGGPATAARIREQFGDRVHDVVQGCTDTNVVPKPPWRARKEAYVAHARVAPADVKVVSTADKLHNERSILADHARVGDAVWSRFSAKRAEIAWYYASLVDALGAGEGASDPRVRHLLTELKPAVAELVRLADG